MKPGKVKVFFKRYAKAQVAETLRVTEWETYDFTEITRGDVYVAVFNDDKLVALLNNETFERLEVIEQPV